MGLESASFIDGLNTANPLGTDQKLQGDNHLRLIKSVLKGTFPNATKAFYLPTTRAVSSTPYTLLAADNGNVLLVDASGGAVTINLLAAATATDGFIVRVVKTDSGSNAVTIDGSGSETINGATTYVLTAQYDTVAIVCNGTVWYSLNEFELSLLGQANTWTKTQTWNKGGDIASASPLVIDSDGNYFDVTGTTSFTTMTVGAGLFFMLQFDGALTMTHHTTTLNLPGAADITTVAGDRGLFFATGSNTVHCLAYTRATGLPVGGISGAAGAIQGLLMSNDSGDTEHDINVTAGICQTADGLSSMTLSTEQTKRIEATWATGNDAGGMASGSTLANDTWFAVHLFTVGSTVEVGFDSSAVAANLIANNGGASGKYRRIGWVFTDGSSNILNFIAEGDYIYWDATPQEKSGNFTTGSRETITIQCPASQVALMGLTVLANQITPYIILSHLGAPDVAAAIQNFVVAAGTGLLDGGNRVGGFISWRVDSSSQLGLRATHAVDCSIVSVGYIDDRRVP